MYLRSFLPNLDEFILGRHSFAVNGFYLKEKHIAHMFSKNGSCGNFSPCVTSNDTLTAEYDRQPNIKRKGYFKTCVLDLTRGSRDFHIRK